MAEYKLLENSWNKVESERKRPLLAVGQGMAMLSPEGMKQHKELWQEAYKQFFFWFLGGNLTGLTIASLVRYAPFKNISKMQIKKYQRVGFIGSLLLFSYHGYKLANRQFRRGKKLILVNPLCIVDEPDN